MRSQGCANENNCKSLAHDGDAAKARDEHFKQLEIAFYASWKHLGKQAVTILLLGHPCSAKIHCLVPSVFKNKIDVYQFSATT